MCTRLIQSLLVMALFQSASAIAIDVNNYRALTSDDRAYRVGESLVILVVESTRAESSAATGVSKGVGISADASDSHNSIGVALGLSGSGDGNGQTVRKGMATTQVSAVIEKVLPNNMVEIEANHNLIVNGESQTIKLTGLVRVRDIGENNTLMSNRIANAKIEIQGVGDVSDAQEQSIFYKVFSWLGIL